MDKIINATKDDIARDYNLRDEADVLKANTELLDSFKTFSKKRSKLCANSVVYCFKITRCNFI